MIISQTSYRISLEGGGTDLPAFYRRDWIRLPPVTSRHRRISRRPVLRDGPINVRLAGSEHGRRRPVRQRSPDRCLR